MNKTIDIELLEENTGQIKGLSSNPRKINEVQLEKLKNSIKESPEILSYRTLLVYPKDDKFVILCGNMRYKACKELGYKEMPCYVLPEDTSLQKLKEFTIKDNIEYGEWDFDLIEMGDWLDFFQTNEFAIDILPDTVQPVLQEIEEQEATEKSSLGLDYTICFADKKEYDEFIKFIDNLKTKYVDIPTVSGRLLKFVSDNYVYAKKINKTNYDEFKGQL